MREIKFRTWVDGRGMNYSEAWGRLGVFFDFHERTYGWDGFVLMQYTGLKDKNGKEIYEGDILKLVLIDYAKESEDIFEVRSKSFYCDVCYLQSIVKFIKESGSETDSIEVIGNKFEHPHLLERRFDHATQTHAKSVHENAGQCY